MSENDERDRLLYELPTNVVVAAGAGTGKTHRLAGLYVHLLAGLTEVRDRSGTRGPLLPEAIVATTFTREAASEMRSRIEERLRALASFSLDTLADRDGPEQPWAEELRQTCARRSVPHPPRTLFARAIEALPRGAITTFHSWAGELVRAYPIEARVPPGFALLEPEEADALIATSLHTVVNEWLEQDDKQPAMRRLLHSGIALLEKNVRSALMRAAEEGVDPAALLLADSDDDIARARTERTALLRALARALELIPPKPRLDPGALLAEARAPAAEWERAQTAESAHAFAAAVKAIFDASPRNSDARAVVAEHVQRGNGTVIDNALALLTGPERTERSRDLAASTRHFLGDVAAAVDAQKKRLRALDFGDVLRRARDLLRDNPEVQASVAAEVRALLVDEFQDTNALQRDLVYLARQRRDEALARTPGTLPEPSSLERTGLFLVGDRKQSIYAFRGADVAVFQQIALEIAGDEARALLGVVGEARSEQPEAAGRVVSLDVNRRSVDAILDFVNALAVVDMRGHAVLSPVEQVVFNAELEALRAVRLAGGDGPRVIVPMIEAPQNNAASPDLLAALAVAGEIRALLDARPELRLRDVAILIRTYAPLSALEFALALHGVEYAVAAGRGLFATSEAGDIEALARLLLDPRDRHALLAVLRGPLVALTDRALLSLALRDGLALPRDATDAATLDADERERLGSLLAVLEEHRRHGARLGAATMLRRALDALGYEATLALLPSGEARIRDVRRLLEHAERFPTGLGAYAEWLARGREGELDEARGAVFDDEHDAVRIMTIHGSKGLEFPVVFAMQIDHAGPKSITGPLLVARGALGLSLATRAEVAGETGLGLGGRALHERALAADRAERQRLSYVALTRARDLLYLVARPGTRIDEHSVARSVGTVLEQYPDLAVQKTLPVVIEPNVVDSAAVPPAAPNYGEGPFVVGASGAIVVTTALAEFATCARRFRLLHVVGLPEHAPRARPLGVASEVAVDELVTEPDPELGEENALPVGPLPTDPRAQGVLAHAALEHAPLSSVIGEGAATYAETFLRREGYDPGTEVGARVAARIVRFLRSSYAASLVDARVERERPFVVSLPSGIALRGTIDLVAVRQLADRTRIEIVDYKSGAPSEGGIGRYELQLRAYAAACARGAVGDPGERVEIVAGIVFLGAGNGEPHWLPGDVGGADSIDRIDEVARRLLGARARGEWPGIEPPGCLKIRCGFYPFCHPESR